MNRTEIADLIVGKLKSSAEQLTSMYQCSRDTIGFFVVDDLLPADVAKEIYSRFPAVEDMRLKKSLREHKYIAVQMSEYDPLLEEAIYAFQDARVVELISMICGIESLHPDVNLYAGGLSLMEGQQFLNPHIDNSHDKERGRWRVLNLLYYVTPDWPVENGGNLEIWPDGLSGEPAVIHSRFNRLAVMATHGASWHSVSPISCDGSARCCVSNYYFSDRPLRADDQFHVTSFRGRPGQRVRDMLLRADSHLRMAIRRLFRKGVAATRHVYKR